MKTVVIVSAVGIGVGTIALSWLTYRRVLYKRRAREQPIHSQWQILGSVQEFNIYPVKSGMPVGLWEADCTEFGLVSHGFHDRNLVLLNDEGEVVYANVHPPMLQVKPEFLSDGLIRITAPNMQSITLDLNVTIREGTVVEKKMKGYRLPLVECKAPYHIWFSRAILQKDNGLRLHIALEPKIDTSWWRNIEREWFPILVLHNKSVEDLNARLAEGNRVKAQRFRANLVVNSDLLYEPYDEDGWYWLRIGDDPDTVTILRYNSDCTRCGLVNIDEATSQRNGDLEPLKTLKKYRLTSHSRNPTMGVHFDIIKAGRIKAGDMVYVQYKK